MSKFTFIDLFAGIGGFRSSLESLGGQCVFSSEIDKFASQSYKALYGHAPEGDITKIEAEDVPDHDVLVGGFPCQSWSVAGKRGGFDDARGTLFFDIARIALEKQPKALLLENVKGLIGHDKGKSLDSIIKTLNDIGYTVDFNVLNSKYFGVPQNRERIFIIALRDDLITPEPWLIEGTTVVPKGKRRISEYEGVKTFNFNWPENSEVTTRLRDVLEAHVDEKYYLSDDKTATLVAQLEDRSQEDPTIFDVSQIGHEGKARMYQEIAPTLTAREYKDPRMVGQIEVLGLLDMKGHRSVREVLDSDGISTTLTTMGGGHREPKTAISEGTRYRIRKLTPLECWRLQGFTDEAHQTVVDAGLSDSQRYKQAGNAVTVNVITAIGERLIPYLTPSTPTT